MPKNAAPVVTILVPCFNHARYVRACLDSAIAQSFEDWELLLIDDGSADESVEVAETVIDPRIRVLRNEQNLGTYGTLQRGLADARGEFVAVLNSDDVWAPEKLALQVEALRMHPEARFCYTLGGRIDEAGNRLEADAPTDWPTDPVQELLPYLLRENRVLASSVLFRRSGLRFHAECRYSGDWLALLELAVEGPAACVAEPLTLWRIHDRNTHQRSPEQLAEEIWVREAIQARKWRREGVRTRDIRAGAARNELHLAALYVLAGAMGSARAAALKGLGMRPSAATAKRLVATGMPAKRARRKLWPEEDVEPEESKSRPPLVWR